MAGIDHAFRITREATGAAAPPGASDDADVRAARRERARLVARDARFDQRDTLPTTRPATSARPGGATSRTALPDHDDAC
jgi:hypothetical protein